MKPLAARLCSTANPKVFLGYSDSTTIQMALLRAGIRSFYGPAIMAGFGENAGLHDDLLEGVKRTLFEPAARLEWPENRDGWTVELLDWSDPATQQQRRGLHEHRVALARRRHP